MAAIKGAGSSFFDQLTNQLLGSIERDPSPPLHIQYQSGKPTMSVPSPITGRWLKLKDNYKKTEKLLGRVEHLGRESTVIDAKRLVISRIDHVINFINNDVGDA